MSQSVIGSASAHSLLRSYLASVVLQLYALGVDDVMKFDFMDKPSVEVSDHCISLCIPQHSMTKDPILLLTLFRRCASQ